MAEKKENTDVEAKAKETAPKTKAKKQPVASEKAKKPQTKAASKAKKAPAKKKPVTAEKDVEEKAKTDDKPKDSKKEKSEDESIQDQNPEVAVEQPVEEVALPKKKTKVRKEKPIVKIENLPPAEGPKPSKKKPNFIRQELYKMARLKDVWRKPRGIDSKKFESKRGKAPMPSIGYQKPKSEQDKHFGLTVVRVFNEAQLDAVTAKNLAVVIASAVGRRKRNLIIDKANKLKITIINPRRGEI